MDENTGPVDTWSDWIKIIRSYSQPSLLKSWWQIINSVLPYVGLWVLMIYSLDVSYWLTLALTVVAAGFLVRIFIIFHDCGHASFFKPGLLQKMVGIFTGFLVFTPFHKWHYEHLRHHQTVGNLDKRGMGDVMTLTAEEYHASSRSKKLFYRIYRNPVVIFLVAPVFLFTIAQHFTKKAHSRKIKLYTHLTTASLVVMVTLLSMLIGFKTFVLIQVPILFFATGAGVWLFYLQHQYEDVVWERNEDWDFKEVAMKGSSYLKFPKILQWFTGNIGFHHIHHLGPRIPNYNLEKCMRENSIFQKKPITFLPSLRSARLRVWNEQARKLVGFREVGVG